MSSQENVSIQDIINSAPASEAKNDAHRAFQDGRESLEDLFNVWLWVEENFDYANEEDKFYAIALGAIEENLVNEGLIYL